MEINIREYLEDTRIAEIVEEEFRYSLRRELKNNMNRFLSNLSYHVASRIVCEEFNLSHEEFEAILTKRIKEVLNNPDNIKFEVFCKKDICNTVESPATTYLREVLKESKPKIEAAVNKIIEQYPFTELHNEIENTIYNCIMRKFQEAQPDA